MTVYKNSILWKCLVLGVFLVLISCNQNKKEVQKEKENYSNILLQEWAGPYGGVPAFDKMKVEDVKEALEKGMELSLTEIDAIANNKEAPTFENTIVAMEGSGKVLDRVFAYYGIFSSNESSPEFREVQKEMAPKLSEYSSKNIAKRSSF